MNLLEVDIKGFLNILFKTLGAVDEVHITSRFSA